LSDGSSGSDNYQRIYADTDRARAYADLVGAEDCDGVLAAEIAGLVHKHGRRALDVGAGTGRVAELLLTAGADVTAVEPAAGMLAVLQERLGGRVNVVQADIRGLDVGVGGFDVVVAGWVLGHLRSWHPQTWRQEVDAGLLALRRATAPGGVCAIIETLGTGAVGPAPPSAAHAAFLGFLEHRGWARSAVLRTDYAFTDRDAALAAMGAFFGARGTAMVERFGWRRIPECTGVWTRPG